MSLVGGFPHQSYHHEFYPYHNRFHQDPHGGMSEHPYIQNWVINAPSDPPMGLNGEYREYTPMGLFTYMDGGAPMRPRVIKRRCTANKKERRRTVSINTAFTSLRDCIPNVPSDTKLSKIKTLRLATSYISYLMDILNNDDSKKTQADFKAEIPKKSPVKSEHKQTRKDSTDSDGNCSTPEKKTNKGRTGWPQHVWASELKPSSD